MSWFGSNLRHALRRLFQRAGYSVASIARQQDEAARLSRERWRWLGTLDIETLVDVGANSGHFAQGFLQQRPGSLVYSFEPLEDCFHELQRQMDGVPGLTAFNVALGDSEGSVDFYRSEFSMSSSLLPMGQAHKDLFPFTREITSEKVTLRMLDSFSHSITIRGGLLIKIDVQGAEAQVLRGGPRLLDRADAVIAEVGYFALYDGQATIGDISGLLAEHGLMFMGYGDALFVRRGSLPQVAEAHQAARPPLANPCSGSFL